MLPSDPGISILSGSIGWAFRGRFAGAGMGTESPQIDVFSPIIAELRGRFDEAVRASGEEEADEVGRYYNSGYRRPYVSTLVADVLSGRWGLGSKQHEISERLGIGDRTWVSRALHSGQMSLDIYLRLRTCPTRPEDWEPNVDSLLGDMERSGFIEVARMFAGLIDNRPGLVPESMDELNYELVCEIFVRFSEWLRASLKRDEALARQIVLDVCNDPSCNVLPPWLAPRERRQTQRQIERLSNSPAAAFEHLVTLQQNWLDVFVGTYDAIDGVRWAPS